MAYDKFGELFKRLIAERKKASWKPDTELSGSDSSNFTIEGEVNYNSLVMQLKSPNQDTRKDAVYKILHLSKNESNVYASELSRHGAIPNMLNLLADSREDINLRVKAAAALCNLCQRKCTHVSFDACDAVRTLVESIIGQHQVLTGAAALILSHMLSNENLLQHIAEYNAPSALLRGLMTCTNIDITGTIIEVLTQMAKIRELHMLFVDTKSVEVCIYFLHNLGRAHYFTTSSSILCETNDTTLIPPNFSTQIMRDPLIRHLSAGTSVSSSSSGFLNFPIPSPEVLYFPAKPINKNLENTIKESQILDNDKDEFQFTENDMVRVSNFLDLLVFLVNACPKACAKLMNMQYALDLLAYWLKNGSINSRQSCLLITCHLLRNGHRGYVTLRDVMDAIIKVLDDVDAIIESKGIHVASYRGVAAETVHDLCKFGGDNMRIAIASAGVGDRCLNLLNSNDIQLQHLVSRALHSLALHSVPRAQLVAAGATPKLTTYLWRRLKEFGTENVKNKKKWILRHSPRKSTGGGEEEQTVSRLSYSQIRRLEYVAATLRLISAVQSPEWMHELIECKIVNLVLEMLNQDFSTVLQKQGLGILASIASLRDSSAPVMIGSEGICPLLFNIRNRNITNESDLSAKYWVAWTNLILHYLAKNPKSLKYVASAASNNETIMISPRTERTKKVSMDLGDRFRPERDYLDLDWISAI